MPFLPRCEAPARPFFTVRAVVVHPCLTEHLLAEALLVVGRALHIDAVAAGQRVQPAVVDANVVALHGGVVRARQRDRFAARRNNVALVSHDSADDRACAAIQ